MIRKLKRSADILSASEQSSLRLSLRLVKGFALRAQADRMSAIRVSHEPALKVA
jgi:hypothetical protein